MTTAATLPLLEQLRQIPLGLRQAVQDRASDGNYGPRPFPVLVTLLWAMMMRMVWRCTRLIDHFNAGTLRAPRLRTPRAADAPRRHARRRAPDVRGGSRSGSGRCALRRSSGRGSEPAPVVPRTR